MLDTPPLTQSNRQLKKLKQVGLGDGKNLSPKTIQTLQQKLPQCLVMGGSIAAQVNPDSMDCDGLFNLAQKQKREDDIDGAIHTLERALKMFTQQPNLDVRRIARCHNLLGDCFAAQNRPRRAKEEYKKSADRLESTSSRVE